MLRIHLGRAILAGLVGAAAMTAPTLVAPAMGFPPMNIGAMLGSVMGGSEVLGWIAHFMIGAILGLIYYAALVIGRLPGPAVARALAHQE